MTLSLLRRTALAPTCWRGRCNGDSCFRRRNHYLIGTYEALVRQILGFYVGLRTGREPKFLQALDVARPPWAQKPQTDRVSNSDAESTDWPPPGAGPARPG